MRGGSVAIAGHFEWFVKMLPQRAALSTCEYALSAGRWTRGYCIERKKFRILVDDLLNRYLSIE